MRLTGLLLAQPNATEDSDPFTDTEHFPLGTTAITYNPATELQSATTEYSLDLHPAFLRTFFLAGWKRSSATQPS